MNDVRSSAWTGWAAFAGVIILVSGVFSLLQGVVLLVGPDTYWAVVDGSLLLFDASGWGWWNTIVGALLLITSIALFSGALWARIVAIILAVVSAAGQLLLIPAQPWWSIVVIAVDIFIIYALTAHGDEFGKRRAS